MLTITPIDFLLPSATPNSPVSSASGLNLGGSGGGLWQTIGGLLIFAVLIVGALFVLRWFNNKRFGAPTERNIQVLERTALTRDTALMVVRVGDSHMLMSVGKEGARILSDIKKPVGGQAVSAVVSAVPQPSGFEIDVAEIPGENFVPAPIVSPAPAQPAARPSSFVDSYRTALDSLETISQSREPQQPKLPAVGMRAAAASYGANARPPKEEPPAFEEIPLTRPPKRPEPSDEYVKEDKVDDLIARARERQKRYGKKK